MIELNDWSAFRNHETEPMTDVLCWQTMGEMRIEVSQNLHNFSQKSDLFNVVAELIWRLSNSLKWVRGENFPRKPFNRVENGSAALYFCYISCFARDNLDIPVDAQIMRICMPINSTGFYSTALRCTTLHGWSIAFRVVFVHFRCRVTTRVCLLRVVIEVACKSSLGRCWVSNSIQAF